MKRCTSSVLCKLNNIHSSQRPKHCHFLSRQSSKGPSIKYVRKNLPIFETPSPPPVRSAYALVCTPPPPPPPPPCTLRTQFSWIYRKCNTELVNRFFYANMFIFNYNMIFIKYKRHLLNIKKKMRTYAAALTPLPPCTQCVRIGLDPPPLPLRAYVLYG